GYPAQQPRTYLFYPEQNINGFIPAASADDGYEIIFTGAIVPGMSGSPLLDENGEIIGVYGRGGYGGPLYGIRINTAIKLAQQQGINIASITPIPQPSPSPVTQKPPTPQPSPTPTPQPRPISRPSPTPQQSPAITTGRSGEQIIALSNPNYARDGIIAGMSGYKVILTPDQQQLISYGIGGNIKVWNLATGQLLRTLNSHSKGIEVWLSVQMARLLLVAVRTG
ncbi:Peptidase S1, chymotrypsin, partial [Crocosphaera watsonii WH 0003]